MLTFTGTCICCKCLWGAICGFQLIKLQGKPRLRCTERAASAIEKHITAPPVRVVLLLLLYLPSRPCTYVNARESHLPLASSCSQNLINTLEISVNRHPSMQTILEFTTNSNDAEETLRWTIFRLQYVFTSVHKTSMSSVISISIYCLLIGGSGGRAVSWFVAVYK